VGGCQAELCRPSHAGVQASAEHQGEPPCLQRRTDYDPRRRPDGGSPEGRAGGGPAAAGGPAGPAAPGVRRVHSFGSERRAEAAVATKYEVVRSVQSLAQRTTRILDKVMSYD